MSIEMVLEFITNALGLAALISFLVNVLKRFGVVKDGTSETWVRYLNFVVFVVLFVIGNWFPDLVTFEAIDTAAGVFAEAGALLVMLFYPAANLMAGTTYSATKGLPLIGFSYSA